MGNLLFSPSGRVGPDAYFKGMLTLGVVSAVINLLPLVSVGLAMIASILGIALLISLIFLGIKRSHDAGKSGWWVLTHLLLAIGISTVLGLILQAMGLGVGEVDQAAMDAAAESGDIGAVMDIAGDAAKAGAIPGAISTLISYAATAFIVNMLNPHDPNANQWGPHHGGGDAGTFS